MDRILVHSLAISRDGGILDWDDMVSDVLDDREQVFSRIIKPELCIISIIHRLDLMCLQPRFLRRRNLALVLFLMKVD